MDVISIQSQVVYGHVGNSAAVFPMQAKGLEVAAVPTALLSNHPHYPTIHGKILEPELVAALLQGVEERGLVDEAKVVVTGYLGSAENAAVVAAFIERALQRNPDLIFVCDPVMGDDDIGIFVQDGLIPAFRDVLVPMATVMTPNQYELELLTGLSARTAPALADAMEALAARGVQSGAITGCVLHDTPPGMVESVTWSPTDGLARTAVRRLPIRPCGTGDLFTALMIARLCENKPLAQAAQEATAEIFQVLQRTAENPATEMRITGFPFIPCGQEK
ncbi:pyridoxal kinase [Aureimonas fodinaquatilis]|uniref:pyridoxal kinase n=1 Tax=Aureimonas fodinaquatilis TaxID=2565783 RepID=A0A5B0DMY2_9HYPH|nr:pyridoxal kinase [Aureimonas fodinaquatilis]KAA0968227.1 pyridoxal kinase [Aureimonas fodinaquatilis]